MTEPIHEAARQADLAALRQELDDGVSPNALGQCGLTPLHYLCSESGNPEARADCLRLLIEAGADVNATGTDRATPLHFAAYNCPADVVATLIRAGAEVNSVASGGSIPLHVACERIRRNDDDAEPALVLTRNGAAVNAKDGWGDTPLETAFRWSTPLAWSNRWDNQSLYPILLRAGAALPAQTTNAYLKKVIAAGGFRQYERNQLATLTATFTSKLRLPARPARSVVEYAFHVGDY